MDLYKEVYDVFVCQCIKKRSHRLGFNSLSFEGKMILLTKEITLPRIDPMTDFRRYRKKVKKLTEKVVGLIPDIHLRGFESYHIDHKISIWHGFKRSIPPEKIADINNLRMIPHAENLQKGRKAYFDQLNTQL